MGKMPMSKPCSANANTSQANVPTSTLAKPRLNKPCTGHMPYRRSRRRAPANIKAALSKKLPTNRAWAKVPLASKCDNAQALLASSSTKANHVRQAAKQRTSADDVHS